MRPSTGAWSSTTAAKATSRPCSTSNGTSCGTNIRGLKTRERTRLPPTARRCWFKPHTPSGHGCTPACSNALTISTVQSHEFRIRTVFALRFGHLRSETDEQISQDAVRAAFNSPFRPFVLTSTSVGQEGLDFHPWCHRLVHWNLPGNPVDLEQREGRVHRYKGHAVRRNVAAEHGAAALASWKPGSDLWMSIFQRADEAARAGGESDLIPHWIAAGNCRVERRVPLLPYAAEVSAFERLKRQLAAYRVVFGQPRQEELLSLLDQAAVSLRDLQELAVDLSPPTTSAMPAMAQPEPGPL